MELQLTESLINAGIAKIEKTIVAEIDVLLITHKDQKDKPVQFDIGESPYSTGLNCESACRDIFPRILITTLVKFITDSWEQVKINIESSTSGTNQNQEQLLSTEIHKRKTRHIN